MQPGKRALKAIMFTDLQGYSALMGRDERAAVAQLREHRAIVRDLLERHGGEEHGTAGDAFVVLFDSALDALDCAVGIQEAHARRNAAASDGHIGVRIGLHLGDILIGEHDIYGDDVNIAARLEPLSPVGGVCVSERLVGQVRNRTRVQFRSLGARRLKNISAPLEVFVVDPDASRLAARSIRRSLLAVGAIAALGVAATLAAVLVGGAGDPEPWSVTLDHGDARTRAAITRAADAYLADDLFAARREIALLPGAEQHPLAMLIEGAIGHGLWIGHQPDHGMDDAASAEPEDCYWVEFARVIRQTRRDDGDQDETAIRAWLEAHPRDVLARQLLAEAEDYSPEFRLAVLEEATRLDPLRARPHRTRVEVLRGSGRTAEAEAAARLAVEVRPSSASAWFALGWTLLKDDAFEEAESALLQSLQLDPGMYFARAQLVDLYLLTHREGRYQEQLSLMTGDTVPLVARMVVGITHGNRLGAMGRAREARELHYWAARLGVSEGYYDDALVALEYSAFTDVALGIEAGLGETLEQLRQVTANPEVTPYRKEQYAIYALSLEGRMRLARGELEEARAIGERLARIEPGTAGFQRPDSHVRWPLLALEGAPEESIAQFGTEPTCGGFRRVARTWRLAGRPEEGREALEGAVDPTVCRGNGHNRIHRAMSEVELADVLLRDGDREGAAAHLSAFHALWPAPDDDLPGVLLAQEVEHALAGDAPPRKR